MKMKNKYIVSSLALALLFGCVPDSRDFNMPDAAVYFTDNAENKGVQVAVMYDVQSEVEVPVYVYCGGLVEGSATVTAEVAEEYIDYYNEAKYTEFHALPQDCYTLVNTSAELSDRSAAFSLKFDVAKIVEYSKQEGVDIADCVVSLGLVSEDIQIASVKDNSLGYYLIRPDLREATARVSATEMTPDGKMTVSVSLPFDNVFDFTYDIEFGMTEGVNALSTSRGNKIAAKYVCGAFPEGTVIGNEDIKSMAPGTNKVDYEISLPAVEWEKGKVYSYAVGVSNAVLNGKQIPVENPVVVGSLNKGGVMNAVQVPYSWGHRWYHAEGFLNEEADYYRHTMEPYGYTPYPESEHKEYVFAPESTQRGYHEHRVFDGTGNAWYAAWNNDGYGYIAGNPDLMAVVDMKKVQEISAVECWLRVDRWVGDTQKVDFYAIDDCTYTFGTGAMSWEEDALTYLGRIDYNGDNHLGYCSLDSIETQYVLVHFAEQRPGRGGSFECTEIVFYHK